MVSAQINIYRYYLFIYIGLFFNPQGITCVIFYTWKNEQWQETMRNMRNRGHAALRVTGDHEEHQTQRTLEIFLENYRLVFQSFERSSGENALHMRGGRRCSLDNRVKICGGGVIFSFNDMSSHSIRLSCSLNSHRIHIT